MPQKEKNAALHVVDIFPLSFKFLVIYSCFFPIWDSPIFFEIFIFWIFMEGRNWDQKVSILCGSLSAQVIYFQQSSFSARGSCFRQSHILPMGRVGSQRAKGTLYRLVKDSKITIWVPCEDSNLKQSAQTRRSQLGGGFRALHSVLVYFHVPRRGAVQIAHTSVLPSGTSA